MVKARWRSFCPGSTVTRALETSSMEVILGILMALIAVVITLVALSAGVWLLLWLGFYLYLTDWTGEHEEAGPLPLSSPEAPIVRLVDTRRTMGGDNKRL